MDSLRDLLNAGWVSSAIGVVSLIAAVIIYRASQVGPRPAIQRRALRLIGHDDRNLPDGVEIRFDGRAVERLTKTHVVFWNSGRTLLRGVDLVDIDPLRFEFSDDSMVLAVKVIKVTRPTNQFTVAIDPTAVNRAVLSFDYLDPGDGAVVELLHNDTKRYPAVAGTIRGVPKGVLDWGRIRPAGGPDLPFPFKQRRTFLLTFVGVGVAAAALGLLLPQDLVRKFFGAPDSSDPARLRLIVAGVGLVNASLPLLLMWLTRRRFPKALAGDELE